MVREVEFPPKHLHAQEGEDDDEEEEKEEQRRNGADRVEERGHQITQRGPVPGKTMEKEDVLAG